jgi:hypothetical protein
MQEGKNAGMQKKGMPRMAIRFWMKNKKFDNAP